MSIREFQPPKRALESVRGSVRRVLRACPSTRGPLLTALALALAAMLACMSCAGSPPAAQRFVGRVDGTDAYVSLVIGGGRVVGYVCDGTEASATSALWFQGATALDAFDLSGAGALAGRTSADGATGTVTLADGSEHAFTASAATGTAGLYRDATSYDDLVGGWIVLADGSLRGAVRRVSDGTLGTTSGSSVNGDGTVTSTGLGVGFTAVLITRPSLETSLSRDASIARVDSGAPVDAARPIDAASPIDAARPVDAATPVDAARLVDASTTCTAAITCSGHGSCSATGTCTCDSGFSGASCSVCAADHYAFPTCRFCSAATTCSGHGSCSATGTCACDTGFTGASCGACAPDFYGFPACRFCSAATTCGGHGSCSATGACACDTGFTGASCGACATDHYGFPTCRFCSAATTCSGRGTCSATGTCTCDSGFSGADCSVP